MAISVTDKECGGGGVTMAAGGGDDDGDGGRRPTMTTRAMGSPDRQR